MDSERLCAYRCRKCKRLTLRWCNDPPPATCGWPTCQTASPEPFDLRRDPYRKEKP